MKNLRNMRVEFWIDGLRDVFALRADTNRLDDGEGLRSIWFILDRGDLESIVSGRVNTAEDGYHKLAVFGDTWTFYDMLEFPCQQCGVIACPYYQAEIPNFFARMLLRVGRWAWKGLRDNRDPDRSYMSPHVELELSTDYRKRICRLYGMGKGSVRWHLGPDAEARLAEIKPMAGKAFDERLDQIGRIARNSTRGFHQTAHVSLSKDWDGFYFEAQTPTRRLIMNGGLVNHGARQGTHDWSIHT